MNIESDSKDPINEDMEENLFLKWIDEEFLPNHVCEPVNVHRLVDDLLASKERGECLDFLGVGCQQFSEVSDGNGESVSIPTRMRIDSTHRFGRFSNEIISLFKSLESFGVKPRLAITFSDAESELTKIKHKDMLHDMDAILESNDREFTEKLEADNVKVVAFSHVEALKSILRVSNFDDLIEKFFDKNEEPTVEEFLDRLYNSDPVNLPPLVQDILSPLGEENSVDTIWLDIMSPLAGDHRDRLHNAIKEFQPDMPIIVPFRNSGKWETAVEPERVFKNRFEFISHLLSISSKKKKDAWLRNALTCSDEKLEMFFNSLGLDMSINGPEDKEKAVKLLEKFTFGTEEFSLIEEIGFNDGDTVKTILVRKTGWTGSHISRLIQIGAVKVNGSPITWKDMRSIKPSDVVSVGTLTLRLKENG